VNWYTLSESKISPVHSSAYLMKNTWKIVVPALILFSLILPDLLVWHTGGATAAVRTLMWSVVNTPSQNIGAVIVNPSEINALALGSDGTTFYCCDTADSRTYKSLDGGVKWTSDNGTALRAAGAFFPVWDIVVAPDDPNFVLAVTDNNTGPNPGGPRRIFFSGDGGANWQNTGFPAIGGDEYIGCLDISKKYGAGGAFRDIAVGTRGTPGPAGPGTVRTIQYSNNIAGSWKIQPSITENITSLKFSPNYDTDSTMVVVSGTPTAAFLHLGKQNYPMADNSTSWDGPGGYLGYPVNFASFLPTIIPSENSTNIINSDLELPSDFSGNTSTEIASFVSILADNSTKSVVLYVNTSVAPNVFNITPPFSTILPNPLLPGNGIYSIAYNGSLESGILLAGEKAANPGAGLVKIWQCSNPQSTTPGGATWLPSNNYKSPTGGGNSGWANAILAWSDDGTAVYCGTSSENATFGGAGWLPGQWPQSRLSFQRLDESAFSRSIDSGIIWNQLSLIDTMISRLSDVAALDIPGGTSGEEDHNTLYLATLNLTENITSFDSVWRSTSDVPGLAWERMLIWPTSDQGMILRVNPRSDPKSQVIVFADLYTDNIFYSDDEGQLWEKVNSNMFVSDITLASDEVFYVADSFSIRKISRSGTGWVLGSKVFTDLDSPAHTICSPLINRGSSSGVPEEIAIVGTGRIPGVTDYPDSYVAYVDFAKPIPVFTVLKRLPLSGDVHVAADSEFSENNNIYAAINNGPGNDGIIYRWTLDTNTDWDYLDPPNRAYYGTAILGDVLYGLRDYSVRLAGNGGGVDRTLHPRIKVPPTNELEWDDITDGLPISGGIILPIRFTREPASLKTSPNSNNTIWAIDNPPPEFNYVFDNRTGCLWSYVDSAARLGPWPTSPAAGSYTGADPVSGRSQQIDFKWRQLKDMVAYDLLLAKDVDFKNVLSSVVPGLLVDNLTFAWVITPADQLSPAFWIAPGALEAGRPYYWKVRGSRALGDSTTVVIHSPWSPVMLFYVKPGFIVSTGHPGPVLLSPVNGPCRGCQPPVSFSWTPVKEARKYEFILAEDAELEKILVSASTSTTSYEYRDKLQYTKPYFWQVRAVSPVLTDPSPTGTFVLMQNSAAGNPNQQPSSWSSDLWITVIIAIMALLMLLMNLFLLLTRRRY